MIIQDTRVVLNGMPAMKEIMVIMHRIMRITTVVITRVITRIIIDHSRHVGRALGKISTITITTTNIGGTFGNGDSRVRTPFMAMDNINSLWPGFPLPRSCLPIHDELDVA